MIVINYHGGDIYKYTQEVIDFSSNINPLGIPESFRAAIEDNLSCIERYPDQHYRKLTASIEKYLQIENRNIGVVLGNGAIEVIYKTIEYLPIKKIILATPTFSEYKRAAVLNNIPIYEVELYDAGGKIDMEKLFTLIEEQVLVILCNPNNPTGSLTPKEELMDLAYKLKEHNGYLMIDETFIEFTTTYPDNSLLDLEVKNLVIIRALTKYFGMPGLRLGYGVFMDRDIGEKVNKLMEPWHINALADLAGQTVLH
ncbi:MAG: aminotransferase class I/II-fold pyridoxal phosphate-dependent enzyme, partial [Clostridium sp.]|nr:aminotransferase class I/II-fold pyridoxal phosphate-dependent enzyme [Clostridium sp.]